MKGLEPVIKDLMGKYIDGKVRESLGAPGGTYTIDGSYGAGGAGLTAEVLRAATAVINQKREIYYRVDAFTPNDEVWLLSAEKKVVIVPPDLVASFVEQATQVGFIAVMLDIDNDQHQQLWFDAMRAALMIPPDELFVRGFGSPYRMLTLYRW